uniref:Phospholipase A2-like central domain-containing protein n=1 Tax=Zonotrichia albicollis TaxID=44394 RepID=A0A8D2QBE7_ZONAL
MQQDSQTTTVLGMWARAVVVCAALCACARAWLGGSVCVREAAGAGGARYVAFLSAGSAAGPALVESVWAAPDRLRACWARRDPRLARAFRAACAQRPPAAPGAALRGALSALWRRRAACTDPVPPGPQRRRRGWTLPGTLWCGAGNSAGNWSELGTNSITASATIACTPFRQCLLAINDTVSNIIGVTFFNLLEVPCFVLEESEECIQWHWWGGCERYGVVPLARMVQQNQYHPSLPAEERGSPTVQPPGKGRNFSRTGRKELRAKPGRRQAGRPKTAPTCTPQLGWPKASGWWGHVLGVPITSPLSSGLGRGCRCTKHLRKCEHQIAPHEVRYQLHNVDSRTLFHCNCMRRCESRRKRPLCAYSWGSEEVGCLPWPALDVGAAGCTMMTRAVLVPAQQLKKILRRWGPLRVSSKAKHLHWKTHARGGILCEQLL